MGRFRSTSLYFHLENLQHLYHIMTEQNVDDPSSLLKHLSQKPGVRSTLVLSTENGAIIQASGAIAQKAAAAAATTNGNSDKRNSVLNASSPSETAQDSSGGGTKNERKGMDSAEDVARMAFDFVRVAGNTLEGLDAEDNVRLLRMRTKKVEFVIVPDPKYILVAVHDMPSA